MTDPCGLTIAELSVLIRGGDLSPPVLLEACLERIATLDPRLHAVNSLRAEAALQEARAAAEEIARGGWRGPLHGIPIGIKDLIDVAGLPTTAQAAHRRDHLATEDAAVVHRLKAAGAIILGKLATHEYAVGNNGDGGFPVVCNPWDLTRDPCGSSSGSAVAVAAGLCPGALGTDTAGSIRDPAAWCGVTGLKPTDGLIDTAGLLPLSRSMDCIGPMARTARDCALMLEAMGGPPVTADLPDLTGIRIGLPRAVWQDHPALDPHVAAVTEAAIARFRDLGAVLEDVWLSDFSEMGRIARNISWPEETAEHGAELDGFPDRFSRNARARLADGRAIPAPEYITALRRRAQMQAALQHVMAGFDCLFLPTMLTAAQPLGYETGPMGDVDLSLARPFNLTGSPALSFCTGRTPEGLPVGGQLVGHRQQDASLLTVAGVIERHI
ncbi:amidase [Neotabrizicola sp. VNH66]|uniref:amidase n=1 Tax=Neotabrizicola sp. VNH66 TaxID=3400918 RepID=UPI003C0F4310